MNINQAIINQAIEAARETALLPYSVHGGCGFAYVAIRMRKNGAGHKFLKDAGWSWDSWHKEWRFRPQNYCKLHDGLFQSEGYNYRVCAAFANVLQKTGINAYAGSWVD